MNRIFIRFFDIIFSMAGILVLLPVFLFLSVFILIDSKGSIVFSQVRVGRYGRDFLLVKFRTMKTDAVGTGLLTVGERDARITKVGYYLRKTKLDELPQLFNVLTGSMSLVGPRPEVRKYVDLYTQEQLKVLSLRPGITDHASIEYKDENTLLGKSENPEKTYIDEIMPHKISLNMKYIEQPTLMNYFSVIFKTLVKLVHF